MTDKASEIEQKLSGLLREVNGLLKDMKAEKREIQTLLKEWKKEVDDEMTEYVQKELNLFADEFVTWKKVMSDKVFKQIDDYMTQLLGESRKNNKLSIKEKYTMSQLMTRYALEQGDNL